MRINLSGWMRRLWTLHESVRSRRIYYQFSDGAVSESELVQQASDTMRCGVSETAMFSRVVQKQAMSLLDHISTLRDEENGYVRIARLWTLLRWRVLSWPEDETICMANMLNVDDGIINILLSTSSHQRMRSFLSLFREIPMSIIFLPGPRLVEPGWRWAPVSWITPYKKQIEHEGLLLPAQRRAIRTSKGLVISCHSFMFHPTPNFPILDRKPLYLLEQKTRVRYLLEPDSSRQRLAVYVAARNSYLAICLESPFSDTIHTQCRRGILVGVQRAKVLCNGHINLCRFLCCVSVTRLRGEDSRSLKKYRAQTHKWIGVTYIIGDLLNTAQLWCIQ